MSKQLKSNETVMTVRAYGTVEVLAYRPCEQVITNAKANEQWEPEKRDKDQQDQKGVDHHSNMW